MVLGQNVSYDVYGTFCVESEGTNMQSRNADLATNWVLFEINTSRKVECFPLTKLLLNQG